MKVAIAQINTTVGDFDGNLAKILDRIRWAEKGGADLVVFPEMAITGYPPNDLLEHPYFILNNVETLEKVARKVGKDIGVIVGHVSINESSTGKGLFNSAAFIHDGRVEYIQNKTLLPTYDVFDEARYFEPGDKHDVVTFKGHTFGITVCEDIWYNAELSGRRLYNVDPIARLVEKGAEFIINISSSPFVVAKRRLRETLLANVARQYKIPIVYVNLVGGNDELIFDGRSMLISGEGRVVREGGAFVEDAFIVDLDHIAQIPKRQDLETIEEVYEALVLGVRDYVKKCGFLKAVIGLSGGIDSALVAAIAVDALGFENVMGIAMPTRFSSEESLTLAESLAKNLNIPLKTISIDGLYQNYLDLLKPEFGKRASDTTEENIQARLRGNILMAFSNKFHAMVLSTGNKSELAVGYCTLYGDMAGGLAVISDIPKTMVYEMSRYLNRESEVIPVGIIERPPSAELKPDQTDQDSLPPYDVLDEILKAYIEDRCSVSAIKEMGFDKAVVEDVVRRIDRSEYKRRQAPPGLKVTTKAFGRGRRCPIACK